MQFLLFQIPISLPRALKIPHFIKKPFNKYLWKIADFYLCWNLNQVIGETLIKNEIGEMESYLIDPADKILVTVSPPYLSLKNFGMSVFPLLAI